MKNIQDSFERQDIKNLKFQAHSLKSPCFLLGAEKLAKICVSFEELNEFPESFHTRKRMIDEFLSLYQQTIKELVYTANSYEPVVA